MTKHIRGFVLALFLGVGTVAHAAGPEITVALYAPQQAESPLHIVGFKYNLGSVQVELSNASNKTVVAAAVVAVILSPSGCISERNVGTLELGGSVKPFRVGPHESDITSRKDSPFDPAGLIMSAKEVGAGGYLQVQVGVVEVDFADGTRWRWREGEPDGPFDVSLLEADKTQCPDSATVRKAWSSISGVRFDLSLQLKEQPRRHETNGDAVPRLLFDCSLDESKALCPS